MENIKINTVLGFSTPIYKFSKIEWVSKLNKISDKHIKKAKEKNIKFIKTEEKRLNKKINDFGAIHHSDSLINEKQFNEFKNLIGNLSTQVIDNMGFDLKDHTLFFTELWVQEFAKSGAGRHEGHIHWNSHISGFYFLKCSNKTSFPIFHDPRSGAMMTKLPLKDPTVLNAATDKISYIVSPGDIILFPSYLEHEFSLDYGIEPFRFIHFNLQAIRNDLIK
jgi:uncharacterized protein (TIGR02466 family)